MSSSEADRESQSSASEESPRLLSPPASASSRSPSRSHGGSSHSSSPSRKRCTSSSPTSTSSQPDLEVVTVKKREAFVLETSDSHVKSCAKGARMCARCGYLKKRDKLNAEHSYINPVTKDVSSWLVQRPGAEEGEAEWGLGCALCRWAKLTGPYVRCTKQNLTRLDRHAQTKAHKEAYARWVRRQDTSGHTPSLYGGVSAGSQDTPPVCGGESAGRGVGRSHVLTMLELFEHQHPVCQFTAMMDAHQRQGGMSAPGNKSRTVATQLVAVCGNRERIINRQILKSCDCLGIMQDAREAELLVRYRAVLWSWPKDLSKVYVDGKTSLNLWSRGEGPFIVERTFGVVSMGSDRSGDANALATWSLCEETCASDAVGLEHLRTHTRFFTADNAADEVVAARTLKVPERLPHLDFEIADSSHCIMLAIKNGCKGDPIVTKNAGLVPYKQKAAPKHCEFAQELLTLAIGFQGGAAGQPLHTAVPLWMGATEVFFSGPSTSALGYEAPRPSVCSCSRGRWQQQFAFCTSSPV